MAPELAPDGRICGDAAEGPCRFRQEVLRALRSYTTPEGVRLPTRTNVFLGLKRAD